jgi:peptide/nickel transport system permease protein
MARAGTEILPALSGAVGDVRPAPRFMALHRLMKKKLAVAGICFIVLFYAAGIFAPVLGMLGVIPAYTDQNLEAVQQGPSWDHPMGTDPLGRDMLSRCIWAAQTTVVITLATLLTGGIILSVSCGMLAGYVGGWVETIIMRVGDAFSAFPTILLLILINASMKDTVRGVARDIEEFTGIGGIVKSGAPDYFLIFGALSLFGWVGGSRVLRAQILSLRESEFIMAARASGASTGRIIFMHLMPNVSNIIIVSLSLSLAGIATSELALTWFGIGIQPPHPSFGALIFEAGYIRTLNAHPHLLLGPATIVGLLLFSFNLLGDALTDVLTPKAR